VTPKDKSEGLTGCFGLPSAREVALDLITMLPKEVEVPALNSKFRMTQILKLTEVEQYFHSDKVPKLIQDAEHSILDGFHINFRLKESFKDDLVNALGS
jgi:hypothetical protein